MIELCLCDIPCVFLGEHRILSRKYFILEVVHPYFLSSIFSVVGFSRINLISVVTYLQYLNSFISICCYVFQNVAIGKYIFPAFRYGRR